jgi:hypothetical protein
MMSKHTPGPWFCERSKDSWFIRPSLDAPAVTQATVAVTMSGVYDLETTKANVALICAAPALLEACESALAMVEYHPDMFGAEQVLRAAIVAARGEPE